MQNPYLPHFTGARVPVWYHHPYLLVGFTTYYFFFRLEYYFFFLLLGTLKNQKAVPNLLFHKTLACLTYYNIILSDIPSAKKHILLQNPMECRFVACRQRVTQNMMSWQGRIRNQGETFQNISKIDRNNFICILRLQINQQFSDHQFSK